MRAAGRGSGRHASWTRTQAIFGKLVRSLACARLPCRCTHMHTLAYASPGLEAHVMSLLISSHASALLKVLGGGNLPWAAVLGHGPTWGPHPPLPLQLCRHASAFAARRGRVDRHRAALCKLRVKQLDLGCNGHSAGDQQWSGEVQVSTGACTTDRRMHDPPSPPPNARQLPNPHKLGPGLKQQVMGLQGRICRSVMQPNLMRTAIQLRPRPDHRPPSNNPPAERASGELLAAPAARLVPAVENQVLGSL